MIEELCEEWKPEPLGGPAQHEFEMSFPAPPLVDKYNSPYVEVAGERLIDLSSFGFLGLGNNPEVVAAAKDGVRKYGVGSCGPRGFHGTFDVHLQTEEELAEFFGVEGAIVFSSGYATVSSTIPAFAKRGDFLICDKGISHALQTGVLLSRSNVYWFKHNDVEDLERVLLEVEKEQKSKGVNMDRPSMRKFLVIEGLYVNYGDIAPLDKMLKLRARHCFRVVMDDSCGFGTLGATGRGTLEHLGIPFDDVDILTSSLANSIGAVGGFCIGKKEVIYHQRLNAAGYVFSASSPPYLLVASCKALSMITSTLLHPLAANVRTVRALLGAQCSELTIHGHALSPIVHLRLAHSTGSRDGDNWRLQHISEECMRQGVAVPRARYINGERYQPPPSLRITVGAMHTTELLERAIRVLVEATVTVIAANE